MDEGEGSGREGAPRILMVAAEIFPLAKTGGLADVASALPKALAALGCDVRLIMPAYPSALDQLKPAAPPIELGTLLGETVQLVPGHVPDSGLPIWLVDCPRLFRRNGTPYGEGPGTDFPDNARRFAVLSHAAARLALGQASLVWQPDIVHCHDWHTGLVPLLLHHVVPRRPRTIFTIHNAAFPGKFPFDAMRGLGVPDSSFGIDGAEFYGEFSFLKAGIRYADKITTVSPTYAREICTPEFGCGFDGLLRARSRDLSGIMNGIDAERWDPASDPCLPHRYTPTDPAGKAACKEALQRELGLQAAADAPLAIFVSRITGQKMADILLHRLPGVMAHKPRLQFALLGQGEPQLESGFREMAARFPGRAAVRIGYSEEEAHRFQAGGDILLHGSRFEPCGLAQMYAMRYGTVPLVRRVGGLADSVVDAEAGESHGTGFVFDEANGDAMCAALDRCVTAYEARSPRWRRLQKNGMAADFSWSRPARHYTHLYRETAPARHAA